jgi:phenylacetate-CoA ligase
MGGQATMAENGPTYFDRQEVRDPIERERSIFHALPGLIRHAIDNAPYFREHLAGIEPDSVTSRDALARIPLVRKAELEARQEAQPPFGGLAATATGRLAHLYGSPGPLYGLEGSRSDYWRFARAMYAAGFRRGEVVLNGFDYHLVPDGFMADFGARALGCPVIPAGSADLDRQVQVVANFAPVAYAGRPSTLIALLGHARVLGHATTSLQKALLAGEPLTGAATEKLARDHGIEAFQCYATAELGLVAYETSARDGLVVDESVIVEIVEPGTGEPLDQPRAAAARQDGPTGEVVVTAFNPDYPLIRFATGALSAIVPGESPCGRTNMRLRGLLGRATGHLGERS